MWELKLIFIKKQGEDDFWITFRSTTIIIIRCHEQWSIIVKIRCQLQNIHKHTLVSIWVSKIFKFIKVLQYEVNIWEFIEGSNPYLENQIFHFKM